MPTAVTDESAALLELAPPDVKGPTAAGDEATMSSWVLLRTIFPAMAAVCADGVGLAIFFPTLLSHLEDVGTPSPEEWSGAILSAQFVGNALGSVVMGYLADGTHERP